MRWRILFLALVWAAPALAQSADEADSNATQQLLRQLQAADDAFFDDELMQSDTALRDSLVSSLDSLGFDEFRKEAGNAQRRFRWDWGVTSPLWDYNRVEGLVAAAHLRLRPLGPWGPVLRGDTGYSAGSEVFRYRASLDVPFGYSGFALRADYSDHVVPYGTNRPQWNPVRALVSGADEQDYLWRRGARASFGWHSESNSVWLSYDAARNQSVGANEDFAIIGEMGEPNAPIAEGIDRAVELSAVYGDRPLSPFVVRASHRVAGGALGGDFTYNRSDLRVERRSFLRRFELQTTLRYTHTAGAVPVQRLADIGGVDDVRGFVRRARVGRSSLGGRAELPIPYDLLRRTRIPYLRSLGLQFVPWADAARVYDGPDENWITSVGMGVQRYLGGFGRSANLRLDVALPLGPDRPADTVVYLRFGGN